MFTRLSLVCSVFVLFLTPTLAFAGSYPGFRELKEEECIPLKSSLIEKLPNSWSKYEPFIKICPLARSSKIPARVSLVSIWSHEYLDSQRKTMWENFPLPMLVDENFNDIGTLPEIFPMSSVTEPIVHYGKWREGLPSEIRVDVYNPTVSGNYYYSPLTWDNKDRRYHMRDQEPKFGSRFKH